MERVAAEAAAAEEEYEEEMLGGQRQVGRAGLLCDYLWLMIHAGRATCSDLCGRCVSHMVARLAPLPRRHGRPALID